MKTFSLAAISTALVLITGAAAAQAGTDEARALAAQGYDTLPYGQITGFVSVGDYRARAHEQARLAQWQARQQAVRAYAAGVRSTPIVVGSEDSARAEAQRVHAEQALAAQATGLTATVAAQ